MKQQKYFETDVYFQVGPARVWDALTNPDKTRQYMYGCAIRCDWEVGSPVLWEAELNGELSVFVKGTLLEIKLFKLMEFTVFVPGSGVADTPENYITLSYALHRERDGTRLHIRQGDYALVDNGDFRYEDTAKLWVAVIPKLIEIAEAREGEASAGGSTIYPV